MPGLMSNIHVFFCGAGSNDNVLWHRYINPPGTSGLLALDLEIGQ
jgi:hypothetical protein